MAFEIKPLVWSRLSEGSYSAAPWPTADYSAFRSRRRCWVAQFDHNDEINHDALGEYTTKTAAKAACEMHYRYFLRGLLVEIMPGNEETPKDD